MGQHEISKGQWFAKGMRDGIPIALGYLAVSFTFGMMAVKDGIGIGQAVLISMTNVTSAGQFAGLDIIIGSGTYLEMALTQLVINLRYSLMAFSLSQKMDRRESWLWRYPVAFGITDEIFAISVSQPGKVSALYNLGAMAIAIPGWVLGTLLGGISGKLMPPFLISAFSVAIYGMFMQIIIPPAKENKTVAFVVGGSMLMSLGFKYLPYLNKVSTGFTVIIITFVAAGLAAVLKPVENSDNEPSELPIEDAGDNFRSGESGDENE